MFEGQCAREFLQSAGSVVVGMEIHEAAKVQGLGMY